ncbi:PrgI family protein, partial [Dysosmobacter welbionis]
LRGVQAVHRAAGTGDGAAGRLRHGRVGGHGCDFTGPVRHSGRDLRHRRRPVSAVVDILIVCHFQHLSSLIIRVCGIIEAVVADPGLPVSHLRGK